MDAPVPNLGPDEVLLQPLHRFSPRLLILIGILLLLVLNMFFMFGRQVVVGLGVTGMNQPVTWAFTSSTLSFLSESAMPGH